MEGIRHREIVVLLTATGIVLVAFSLTSPWFNLTTANISEPPGFSYAKSHYEFYTDFYRWNSFPSSGLSSAYDQFGALASLMSLVKDVMLTWLILSLVFLGLTLANSRGPCIGVGLIMVAAMALAVAAFAIGAAGAISAEQGMGGPVFPHLGGFFGSMISGGGAVSVSWGPSLGWFLALVACATQAIALLLGSTRVLSGRGEEPGPAKGQEDSIYVSEVSR